MSTTQVATTTRKIKVVVTRGENRVIESSATKWGELEKQLKGLSYDVAKLGAVEGKSRHTLEHAEAVLPEGNFVLFLIPVESKSGAKAAAKRAAPKKAAKKAAPKKAPKKAAVKKAAPKKAAKVTVKKDTGIADVVDSVKENTKATEEVKVEEAFPDDNQLNAELNKVKGGIARAKRY